MTLVDVACDRVLTRGSDLVVRVFDAASLTPVSAVVDNGDKGQPLALVPGSRECVTAGPGKQIAIRDLDDLETRRTIALPFLPSRLAFAPDRRSFAIQRDQDLCVLSWPDARVRWQSRPRPKFSISAIAWSRDSEHIAVSSSWTIHVVDARTGRADLAGLHGETVRDLCFLPGRAGLLASAGEDRAIRIWDWRRQAAVAELAGHASGVLTIDASSDGKRLVSGSRDGAIKLWDLERFEEVLSFPQETGWVEVRFADAEKSLIGSASTGVLLRIGTEYPRSNLEPDPERHARVARGEEPSLLRDAWQIALNPSATTLEAKRTAARLTAIAAERERVEIYLLRAFAGYREGKYDSCRDTLRAHNVRGAPPPLEQTRLAFLAMARAKLGASADARDTYRTLQRLIKERGRHLGGELLEETLHVLAEAGIETK